MKHLEKNKPWLTNSGELHTIEALREISKSWSYETWEEYLSSLEKQGSESTISSGELERQTQKWSLETYAAETLPKGQPAKLSASLKKEIAKAISQLPWSQKRIINCIFKGNKRVCEVAELLRLEESHVIYLRDKALRDLGAIFKTDSIKNILGGMR